MGMHLGYIVAAAELEPFRVALGKYCGTFTVDRELWTNEWLDRPPRGVDAIHVSSSGGKTYALDFGMAISSGHVLSSGVRVSDAIRSIESFTLPSP